MTIIKRENNLPSKGLDITALRKKSGITKARAAVRTHTGLQMVSMFDITGSMFGYFALVIEKIGEIMDVVSQDIKNLEMGIMAYRNHGDEARYGQIYYVHPLTSDINSLHAFMSKIRKGGGGKDALTCMEDCLAEANQLRWRIGTPKALVIVGDMPPHGVIDSVAKCPNDINYEFEVAELKQKGINIYSVFCGRHGKPKDWYQWIAKETGGRFLEIKDIDLMAEILIGISMKSVGNLEGYIKRMKVVRQLPARTENMLRLLE